MDQVFSTYNVAFNQLPERYGITQGTLSHRVKKLGLKTVKRGRNTYLTATQLAELDKLDRFLKENPNSDIHEFLISNELIPQPFINKSLVNYQPTEKLLSNKSLSDNLIIGESSLTKDDFLLSQKKLARLVRKKFDTINKQLSDIKEITSNIKGDTDYQSQILEGIDSYIEDLEGESDDDYLADNQSISDKLRSEQSPDTEKIRQLESQVSRLQRQIKELSTEKEKYYNYYEYWSRTLPNNFSQHDIRFLDGFCWIRSEKPYEQLNNELPIKWRTAL